MKNEDRADLIYGRKWPCGSMSDPVPKRDGTAPDNRGFTMVELLAVCAVLGALMIIAIPTYAKYKDVARSSRAMNEIRMLETALTAYLTEKGFYPPSDDLNAIGYGTLKDPWGHAYQYKVPGGTRTLVATPLNSDFDLYSLGADGASEASIAPTSPTSQDDIIRISDGAFVGRADHY